MKLFPWALFRRFVLAQWFLVLATICAAGVGARTYFKDTLIAQSQQQQEDTLAALAQHWEPSPEWCRKAATGTHLRITLVESGGTVICDSESDPASMDNHGSRPEILAAGIGKFGHSFRHSDTLGEEMLYSALRVDGYFVRTSLHLSELGPMLRIFDRSIAAILALTALVLGLLSLLSARRLVLPLAEILRKFRVEGNHSGDWNELESSMNSLSQELNSRVEELLTERAQQATVLGAISDGILAVDRSARPLFFNSRFELYFGQGRPLRELEYWQIFRAPELMKAFSDAVERGRATILSHSIDSEEEGKRHFSVSIAPLTRSAGAVYGAVGIFHDITDIKRAEQLRIDFVANVSHELRTPLTAIKGYADTLSSDVRAGRPIGPEFIDIIRRNSDRLMSLIQDLLDISALESSAVLQKTRASTRELSERILESLSPVMKARNQHCALLIQAQTVYADPQRLEQVIVNLLDNASKYSGTGAGVTLTWEPWRIADTEGVLLKISDTGPGIPAEHLPRLFERFYRIDKARSREQGGTGLGLAIVKHILQRHRGNVWVESTVGKGTTFFCFFPDAETI